jgi:hypothetical protein
MEAKLLVISGKIKNRWITLKLPTIIGRSKEADLTIGHPLVSRRHCVVFEENGLLMIRDLGSLNGTTVQGRRIETAPLLPEAEFTVGPVTFRAKYEYAGDLGAVPTARLADDDLGEDADQTEIEPIEEAVQHELPGAAPPFDAADEVPGFISGGAAAGMEMSDFLAWDEPAPAAKPSTPIVSPPAELPKTAEAVDERIGPVPSPPPTRQEIAERKSAPKTGVAARREFVDAPEYGTESEVRIDTHAPHRPVVASRLDATLPPLHEQGHPPPEAVAEPEILPESAVFPELGVIPQPEVLLEPELAEGAEPLEQPQLIGAPEAVPEPELVAEAEMAVAAAAADEEAVEVEVLPEPEIVPEPGVVHPAQRAADAKPTPTKKSQPAGKTAAQAAPAEKGPAPSTPHEPQPPDPDLDDFLGGLQ